VSDVCLFLTSESCRRVKRSTAHLRQTINYIHDTDRQTQTDRHRHIDKETQRHSDTETE
jgi:hypothetical protein